MSSLMRDLICPSVREPGLYLFSTLSAPSTWDTEEQTDCLKQLHQISLRAANWKGYVCWLCTCHISRVFPQPRIKAQLNYVFRYSQVSFFKPFPYHLNINPPSLVKSAPTFNLQSSPMICFTLERYSQFFIFPNSDMQEEKKHDY